MNEIFKNRKRNRTCFRDFAKFHMTKTTLVSCDKEDAKVLVVSARNLPLPIYTVAIPFIHLITLDYVPCNYSRVYDVTSELRRVSWTVCFQLSSVQHISLRECFKQTLAYAEGCYVKILVLFNDGVFGSNAAVPPREHHNADGSDNCRSLTAILLATLGLYIDRSRFEDFLCLSWLALSHYYLISFTFSIMEFVWMLRVQFIASVQ